MSREVVLEGTTLCTPGLDAAAANAASVAFRVLSELGQGGMGIVYRAEQLFPRRTVALKVLKRAIADAHAKKRFAREAEITGRLNHRSIAQVYVAGLLKDGMPFMAMEFVHGTPLTAYAQDRRLSLNARLELMLKVCDAVDYAHRQGVIHRDLKPSNILVDEAGELRILDFGLAAEPLDAGQSLLTIQGQMVGTLDYMSPEQAEGRTQDIDEQSDVYGLGVLLYELLALRRPFDFSSVTLPDAVRAIRETAPPKLSANNRALRGDLETIVGKALCKEKFARYRSVDALRTDLRHWLAHEPITARPPNVLYRSSRFVRKYRGFVSAVTAVIVALSTGLGVAIYEAVAANAMWRQVVKEKTVEETQTAGTEILLGDKLAEGGDPVGARKHYEHAWSLLEGNGRSAADPRLAIWNLDQKYGRLIDVLEPSARELHCMVLSRDQKHLALEYSNGLGLNNRVEVRNPLNNKREVAFELQRSPISMMVSPDGKALLTVESSHDLTDSHFSSSLYTTLPQPMLIRGPFEADRIALGNDRFVYVDSSHYLKVAKLSSPDQARDLLKVAKVIALELRDSSAILAQADGQILRVNTNTGESTTIASLGDLTRILGIALSPNGDYAVVSQNTGNMLVELNSGRQISLPEFELTNGGFADDSTFYAFSIRRQTIVRFNASGNPIRTVPCYFNGQTAYSKDLVVTQDRDFSLKLWATAVPAVSRTLADPTSAVPATALSSDGYIAAVGGADGMTLIKDAALGHVLDRIQLDTPAKYLAFDQATSRLLAISNDSRKIDIYAIPGNQRVLHCECTPIQTFAFSADGKRLALAEPSDNQLEILSEEEDSWKRHKFSFSIRETVLGFSADGRFLSLTNEAPTLWHVDVPSPYRVSPSELMEHPIVWRPAVILQRGAALRTVNAFDPNTTKLMSTISFDSDRFFQAVDEELCFAADSNSIAAFNPKSGQVLRAIAAQNIRRTVSVSENGERMLCIGSGVTWLNFDLPDRLRHFERYRTESVSGAWTNAAAEAQWLAALGIPRELLDTLVSPDRIWNDNDLPSAYAYWSMGQTAKAAQIIRTAAGLTAGARALILSRLNVSTATLDDPVF